LLKDAGDAIASGRLQDAETDLQSILSASPEDYQALDLLAIVRAQQRREPEAEQIFLRVVKAHPDFASAHIDLGFLYLQMGEPEKAVPELQEGLRLAPERTEAASALVGIWREQARAALSSDPEKALSLLLQARKIAPADADVQFEFGMVALRMNLLPDAVTAFQETLKLRPDDPQAVYGLGRTFMQQAKYDDARQQFVRYCALRPADASGHYALGNSYAMLERSADARSEFEKSIALAPVQTESYFQLGLLDLKAHDLDSATQNFTHVLGRDPNHAGALAGMGRVAFERKKYDEGAEYLQRSIASDQSLYEAHYYLGLTYARLGRKQESDEQFQIATRLEHEQLEKERTVFTILNPGTSTSAQDSK
jgi:tetratricopeptide (TPR) repeat protein